MSTAEVSNDKDDIKMNTLNNSRKGVIKCTFNVAAKDLISLAPFLTLVAHLNSEIERAIIPNFLDLFSKQFASALVKGVC